MLDVMNVYRKMMDFLLEMIDLVLKVMEFAPDMIDFVPKLMDLVLKTMENEQGGDTQVRHSYSRSVQRLHHNGISGMISIDRRL